MYSFFYNILTTLTGGKSFEAIRKLHYRQVQKTLKGQKFSNIDTKVFASITQRHENEKLFDYIKRRRKLNSLSVEDKQRYINSEKKRLYQAEQSRKKNLNEFLGKSTTPVEQQQRDVQQSIHRTFQKKLSPQDALAFERLPERHSNESYWAFLKRSKQLYRLPVEQKLQLVQKQRQRDLENQRHQEASLRDYLATSPSEVVYEKKFQVKEALREQKTNQSQDAER